MLLTDNTRAIESAVEDILNSLFVNANILFSSAHRRAWCSFDEVVSILKTLESSADSHGIFPCWTFAGVISSPLEPTLPTLAPRVSSVLRPRDHQRPLHIIERAASWVPSRSLLTATLSAHATQPQRSLPQQSNGPNNSRCEGGGSRARPRGSSRDETRRASRERASGPQGALSDGSSPVRHPGLLEIPPPLGGGLEPPPPPPPAREGQASYAGGSAAAAWPLAHSGALQREQLPPPLSSSFIGGAIQSGVAIQINDFKPKHFPGKSSQDIRDWLESFSRYYKIGNFQDVDCGAYRCSYFLTDEAAQSVSGREFSDFAALEDHLTWRFGEPLGVMQNKLLQRKQQPNESAAAYADALRILGKRVSYPSAMLISQFVNGLLQPLQEIMLTQRALRQLLDWESTVHMAKRLEESLATAGRQTMIPAPPLDQPRSQRSRDGLGRREDASDLPATPARSDWRSRQQPSRLSPSSRRESTAPWREPPLPPERGNPLRRVNQRGVRFRLCDHCDSPGHASSECPRMVESHRAQYHNLMELDDWRQTPAPEVFVNDSASPATMRPSGFAQATFSPGTLPRASNHP